jgi:hypothetical protein
MHGAAVVLPSSEKFDARVTVRGSGVSGAPEGAPPALPDRAALAVLAALSITTSR